MRDNRSQGNPFKNAKWFQLFYRFQFRNDVEKEMYIYTTSRMTGWGKYTVYLGT